MSVATIAEVNWNNTVDNTNKIGISDTFDNLPVDVWADNSVFVTAHNNLIAKFTRLTTGYPSTTSKTSECPWYLSGGIGYSNIDNNSNSLYIRSVLLAVPSGFSYDNWNGNTGGMIRNTNNSIRIITSMSTVKNGISVSLTEDPSGAVTSQSYIVNETLPGSTADGSFDYDGVTYFIIMADVYSVEGDYFLNIPTSIMGNVYDTDNGDGVMGSWAYSAVSNKMFSVSPQIFETNDGRISIVGGAVYNVNTWHYHELPAVDGDENLNFYASYVAWNWYLQLTGNVHYHLLNVSRYGLKFSYNSDDYKPVIIQGVVTGYTTDMTIESDIDNWTDISGHNISPSPPPPPPPDPDEDNNDPVSTAGAPYASGLAHYYVTTAESTALSRISEAMSTWDIDATKKDLYKNLISCKLIKPPAGIPSDSSVFEIYGVKPQYQGADITIPKVKGNPDITFGPYNIDRKFNDFRDFAPYTKVEIHLPYCGWCALPSHVVGRSVSVHYYTDVIAATCKAVVFCGNNNIVAEAAGVIGLDIPFASENVGAKVAAATSGLLSYGQGALQASAGIGQMAATRSSQGLKNTAGGLSQVISGYTQMAMAANENWTEICGKNGDGCCLSGATDIIIKITRPKYGGYDEAPYVPPGFAHAVGFVSCKQVRVSNITGLLIADNVDTSGISGATDAERAEIKRVLETGLIVNPAPEE